MYSSQLDIQEINSLIHDIQSGRVSRNKNYFTLTEVKAYHRFKRAKLLISIIDDLNFTASVLGNKIEVEKGNEMIEIRLFNPILRYRRRVIITEAELNLIRSQTNLIQ
ncbi:MAG: hypothetical protein HOE30_12560 [Deltaproteobacteria bacterium]|nr:hypothetical protein [Deltaproteobacteria bacterium]